VEPLSLSNSQQVTLVVPTFPSLVYNLPSPLSCSKMDILNDTYGNHNTIYVSLSIEDVNGSSTLLGFPSSSQGNALKCLLRASADIKLMLWKPVSYEYYVACLPDGTSGYHFLYQHYLRGY